MNKLVKEAVERNMYNQTIPNLEIGDIVRFGDIWDEEGETPEKDYGYKFYESEGGISYSIFFDFEFLNEEDKERSKGYWDDEIFELPVKITGIEIV